MLLTDREREVNSGLEEQREQEAKNHLSVAKTRPTMKKVNLQRKGNGAAGSFALNFLGIWLERIMVDEAKLQHIPGWQTRARTTCPLPTPKASPDLWRTTSNAETSNLWLQGAGNLWRNPGAGCSRSVVPRLVALWWRCVRLFDFHCASWIWFYFGFDYFGICYHSICLSVCGSNDGAIRPRVRRSMAIALRAYSAISGCWCGCYGQSAAKSLLIPPLPGPHWPRAVFGRRLGGAGKDSSPARLNKTRCAHIGEQASLFTGIVSRASAA